MSPLLEVKYFHCEVIHVTFTHIPLAKISEKAIPHIRGVEWQAYFVAGSGEEMDMREQK